MRHAFELFGMFVGGGITGFTAAVLVVAAAHREEEIRNG